MRGPDSLYVLFVALVLENVAYMEVCAMSLLC